MKQLLLGALFLCSFATVGRADDLKTAESFREAAAKANSLLTLPSAKTKPAVPPSDAR